MAAADDWETADRLRYAAYCLDETCAIVGMQRENELVAEARATATTKADAPDGATVKRGVIEGRVPYRPDLAPAWLDTLFPEGPITSRPPGEILIA